MAKKTADTYTYRMGDNLYINLTNKCQNNCGFCLRQSADGILDNTLWLTAEPTAQQVIDDISRAQPFCQAVFCGYGEPTMAMDVLVQVAEYLKSIGARVRLNTNGIAGAQAAERIAGLVDEVSVSLNAPNEQIYNEVCRPSVPDAYGKMLDFVRACKQKNIDVRFTVVDTIGEENIDKCREVAFALKVPLCVRKYISDNRNYT